MLDHAVPDRLLGAFLREALTASRMVDPNIDRNFFDSRGRIAPDYQSWVARMMQQFDYKTKRAMFKDMKNCSVELFNGCIKLEPWHHAKLEAWDGAGITEADTVSILANSPDEEIGVALRLALSRCT